LLDVYVEAGRWPVNRFPSIYAELARNHPHLWWLIYRAAVRQINPSWIIGAFTRSGLARVIEREHPDVVISVLPAVNDLLAHACRRVGAHLEVVLTDWHSVHPYWVARGVEHYTAPTVSARDDCVANGARPEAIDVVGIPVRREFATPHGMPGDHGRFTVLAMMGAEGSPRAVRNIAALASAKLGAHLVVVCGRSEALRQQIARLPVQTLGFVDNIAELMRSADVLVTKAGGVTLAEAFCCRTPVVIHDVLPGQEAGNLEYVLGHGAVAYAPSPAKLVDVVRQLMLDAQRRAVLAECGARLARPTAAQQISANVLARLDAASAQLGRHG
jgi:UDP-N-acetylglucosamine:LPS N-acetylglucosamine transferase